MDEKKKIRAPFPWFGGKGAPKIRSAILEALPPHTRYLEPFGGGASILISKQPVQVEVYNDVNREMPYSRELYEECLRTWPAIHDPVEQAARWYCIARQSFSGIFGKSWGSTVNSSNGGMAETTGRWRSSFDNLPLVHDRMQRVQIECCDWRDVLRRFSGPGWLAYCDPPYVPGSRKAGGYEHELKDTDHEELIWTLLSYDGAVVLSGYDTPLYAPLASAGWDRLEVEVTCSAAGRTRASGLQGDGKVKERQRRTECLWRNPEAMRRIRAVDSARK